MIEITPTTYEQVRPLFPDQDMHLSVKALLAGHVPGQVYVDDPIHPRSAMARIGGRFYLGGSPDQPEFNRELSSFFAEKVHSRGNPNTPYYFIVKCIVPEWAKQMDVVHPGKVYIPKIDHYYNGREVRHDWRSMLPSGISLRLVDRALLDEGLDGLDELREEMCSERPSVEEFLDKSFGLVPVHGNQVIGWCMSEYNCGDRCEVGIATKDGYRRQGLATCLASAFIEQALAQGIVYIGWHCDSDNTPSIATALKLGFTKALEYPAFLCQV